MSLFDLLACPTCKCKVQRAEDSLTCGQCLRRYPIVNGIPVMMPDGSVPQTQHEHELVTRATYDPWVFRTILQSLADHQVVLEIGSGNMTLDDPNVIRMDVMLTPYVDLVADACHLPFQHETLDYVFSLAVFEHLRDPFQAARSIFDALKDGGLIYHECNFNYAYHGYPHHYFNATLQGLEQVFADFRALRTGVAPYQMPSFAIDMLLRTWLQQSQASAYEHGRRFAAQLEQLMAEPLTPYDIYFTEEQALRVAAGTYFAGVKELTPESTTIPTCVMDAWRKHEDLRQRFPDVNQLTTADNLMTWARNDGRATTPGLAAGLDQLPRFNKRGENAPWDRSTLRAMPVVEPRFGAIGFDPDLGVAENARRAALVSAPPNARRPPSRLRQAAARVPLLRRFYRWARTQVGPWPAE